MSRDITSDIHWIQECNQSATFENEQGSIPDWGRPNSVVHNSNSAFLICGSETLVFDTLSPAAEQQVLDELDEILENRSLDYIVPSHPETPHAGNTLAIRDRYPEATILAPDRGSTHDLYYLEDARGVSAGEVIDLGGREIEFLEAWFLDHGMSLWAHERTQNILFTVDWVGFPHLSNWCLTFVDELDDAITKSQLHEFHGRVFSWYEFVDTTKTHATIDYLIQEFGDAILAPAHGLVFRRGVAAYLEEMKAVIEEIEKEGRVTTGTIW